MPDFVVPDIEGTAAEKAVHYVLQRVINDRNFSHVMFGTGAMQRCLAAEAQRMGTSPDALKRAIRDACVRANERLKNNGADVPDVVVLRKRIERITQDLDAMEEDGHLTAHWRQHLYELLHSDPAQWPAPVRSIASQS